MTPRPYQLEGCYFLAARRFALLADEMRVGKTPQAILAADMVKATKILVICPAIAVEHWHREWRKWYGHLGRAIMPRLTVLSYDRAKLSRETILAARWDLVIVDECHFAKNPQAERTRLIYGKDGVGWRADRMWVLSGTPAPKHAGELWCMLRAFGAVNMTYREFTEYYCYFDPETQRIKGTRADRIPELRAILSTIMLRRTRKQVAPEMPGIDFQFLEVAFDKPSDLAAVPAGADDDALLGWLAGHPDPENRQAVALAKVGPLVDQIEFALDNELLKQTVVFGWHVEPLKAMARSLVVRGITAGTITGDATAGARSYTQHEFREGRLQVVCANILAAGTAIDLSAASHGYFLELDWVPGNNVQAASRLISLEKDEPVTMDVATCPGTTDDRVQKVLLRRASELAKMF